MDVVCPRLVYVTIQYITTVNLLPHHFPLPPSPRSPPPALLSPILHHPPPPPRSRYYDLYHATAVALKAASNNTLRVGGPATSNTTGFLQPFLDAAKERGAPVDFLSSHKYPKSLAGRDEFPDTVAAAAAIAAANGLPYVLSEFNSGLGLFCCHDTHYAAAFLIRSAGAIQQRRLCRSSRGNTRTGEDGLGADDSGECDTGGTWKGTGTAVPDVMSFWTFSDVFEEVRGVDANAKRAPFHNAYGLVTMDGIPKASFRALQLLRRMPNETVAVERISRVGGGMRRVGGLVATVAVVVATVAVVAAMVTAIVMRVVWFAITLSRFMLVRRRCVRGGWRRGEATRAGEGEMAAVVPLGVVVGGRLP